VGFFIVLRVGVFGRPSPEQIGTFTLSESLTGKELSDFGRL
jgi:hypothetical protein